jgi:cytochrome oxidase Cu insertion factor (SCO1/SenC/PrrC family)
MKTAGILILAALACGSGLKAPAPAAQTTQSYVCPMHSDVKSESSASCPKCGMSLVDATAVSDSSGSAAPVSPDAAPVIPEAAVVDQDGNRLSFYSDLVKGRTVAINFIFTTCTTICPPLTATFRRVQQDLGNRAGRDVSLISISVDPVTDVPARLKSFASRFGRGPGWTFVTGDKAEIDSLLRSLGGYAANKTDHTPSLLIINDRTGYWTRTYGLASPATILKEISNVGGRQSTR